VGANKLAGQSEDEGGRLRRIWKKSDGFSEMKWSVSVKGPSCQHDRGQAMQKPISAPIVRHHSNATAHQSTNRRGPERPLLTRYTPVAAPLRQNRSRTTRGLFFSKGRVPVVGSEMGHLASFTTDRPVVYWKSRTLRFLVLSP
jgi:hypothetical protein